MKKLANAVWWLLRLVGGLVIGLPFLMLIFMMFAAAPVEIVLEAIDLALCTHESPGKILDVRVERGGRSTSATRIDYEYTVNGQRLEGSRVFPGYMADVGFYTGGDSLTSAYQRGNPCSVFFSPADPGRSFLIRGWHVWSIAWTVLIWGMVCYVYLRVKRPRIAFLGLTAVLYGIGLLLSGIHAVHLSYLHWHALAIAVLTFIIWLGFKLRGNSQVEDDSADPNARTEGAT